MNVRLVGSMKEFVDAGIRCIGDNDTPAIDRPGQDALWTWFSLSYASWLTLPRVLMHAMPDEWQGKMAALLEEYDETFCNWDPDERLGTRVNVTSNGRIIRTPSWMKEYRHPDNEQIDKLRGLDSTP